MNHAIAVLAFASMIGTASDGVDGPETNQAAMMAAVKFEQFAQCLNRIPAQLMPLLQEKPVDPELAGSVRTFSNTSKQTLGEYLAAKEAAMASDDWQTLAELIAATYEAHRDALGGSIVDAVSKPWSQCLDLAEQLDEMD